MQSRSFIDLPNDLTLKKIRKKNLSRLLKNWYRAIGITGFKLFTSTIKSFFLMLAIFSILKKETSFSILSNPFFQYIKPIKDINQPIFIVVSLVFLGMFFIILLPLEYGVLFWFSNLTNQKRISWTNLFYYYSKPKLLFKTIGFKLEMYFRLFVAIVSFLVPSIFFFIYACIKMQTVNNDEKLFFAFTICISIILLVFGIYMFIKKGPKNLLLPYIQTRYLSDNNIKIHYKDSIDKLNKLTSLKKLKFFIVFASFLLITQPFILSPIVIFPYFATSLFTFVNILE